MSDLTLDQLKRAYDASLEQIAAESFLFQGMAPQAYVDALRNGNNLLYAPDTDNLEGKLRMTAEQAQGFVARYAIIDAYQNDATGLSAVALRDNDTPNRVVIAVRSTELLNDRTRDVGADLQIFTSGFAFEQILSAEDFLNRIRPQLQSGEKIDLVGYSLSGNIVRTVAAMYPDVINQTLGSNVVFNATGLGEFRDPTGQNRSRDVVLQEMMSLYRQVETDPNNATDVPFHLLPLKLAALATPLIDRTDPNGNVYPSPRQDFAQAYIQNRYGTFYNDFGTIVAEPSFAQYVGVALSGFDVTAVANSGSHPVPFAVAIEGQPVVEIPGLTPRFDYLNTHSLTLIADSLRLQILFKEIDNSISTDTIQAIFQASSASAANTLLGRAEKDTLENALDAVRRALLPVDQNFQPTPSSAAAGSFGNLANRTAFHNNITAVENVLPPQPSPYRIEALVNQPLEAVKDNALLEDATGKGLAYRYALTALNPFAIIGPTYSQHNVNGELALFSLETGLGAVTIDYIQDRGLFLAAKVALNQTNLDGPLNPFSLTHYHDNTTAYDIPSGLSIPSGVQREYIFGSDNAETIAGGPLLTNDHLYGGDGDDTLQGFGGEDYLQGDGGNDRLEGGSGADLMMGGQGNDTYVVDNIGDRVTEGFNNGSDTVQSSVSFTLAANLEDLTLTGTNDLNGTGNDLDNLITGNSGMNRLDGKEGADHLIGNGGNDVLIGGAGDQDLLEGGIGFDTYIYNAGDGVDRIEDSDAQGQIIFNGQNLLGGLHHPDDPQHTYKSLDGLITYVLSGTDLIVNGVLTVNENFQSGQFGIRLIDVPETTLPEVPTIDYGGNGLFTEVITLPVTGSWIIEKVEPVNYIFQGGQGTYHIYAGPGNDQLYGGPKNDRLSGRGGQDFLEAFAGDDELYGWEENDVLLGGDGNDRMYGDLALAQAGQDYMDGGEGDDLLIGGAGDDTLIGGEGNDILMADGGTTELIIIPPDDPFNTGFSFQLDRSLGTGDDLLDGGIGDDMLVGFAGEDVLLGGDGADILYGDAVAGTFSVPWDPSNDGADYLEGGAGNDTLFGGGQDDVLLGGAGNDVLWGEGPAYVALSGDDWLDGGDGNDFVFGGLGADTVAGGAGDDVLSGDFTDQPGADDILSGGAGVDQLYGGGGNDLLVGGSESDFLLGEDGDDDLFGDEGNDELQGGAGADFLSGGAGMDRLLGQDDDDTLFGDEGDDALAGGLGNDLLSGDAGDDVLDGHFGDDHLFGGIGNDGIAGGEGNDALYGDVGNDTLQGDQGNDVLVGGAGNDIYNFSFGDGQDTITDTAAGAEGNFINFFGGITLESLTFVHNPVQQMLTIQVGGGTDSIRLLGFDPNTFQYVVETLRFSDGSFVALADLLPLPGGLVEGTDEADVIRTGSGDDTVFAGDGDDGVHAGIGNDMLAGGSGDDTLEGGAGQDRYLFNTGDGADTIVDTAGEGNRVVFGTGIVSSALSLSRSSEQTLVLALGNPGDHIVLSTTTAEGGLSVDSFAFADGSTLTGEQLLARGINIAGTPDSDIIIGTTYVDRISAGSGDDVVFGQGGADTLDGGAGNDSLEGEAGNDVLVGGAGDDQLNGGEGNDTYRFNLGDGLDSIFDSGASTDVDTVVFGTGITADSLSLTTSFGQIQVNVGSGVDALLVGSGSDVLGSQTIEQLQFADGTSLNYAQLIARGFEIAGTSDDDFLFGTNVVDRFHGGFGNDQLEGGDGNDSYLFNSGDGVDEIVDVAVAGAGNEVVFGLGISQADIRLDLVPDQFDSSLADLWLHIGTNGNAIQLDTFDRQNVFGPRTVDTFRFADGSTLTYDQLLARGFDITGTAGNDQLLGTNTTDRIVGFDGTDVLRAGAGDDQLDGGAGSDQLYGGQGNDTYVFGPGSGLDTVVEFQGSQDRIRMAMGVAPSDVAAIRDKNDLVLSLNGTTDRLTVFGYFLSGQPMIELVEFADGTVWDQTFLNTLVESTITGTTGPDVLVGTNGNDRLFGLGGNDHLTGMAGHDLLDGGSGSDQLTGGLGDDTYIVDDPGDVVRELPNEGIDTVQSSVTRTLEPNVENLILTGTTAINGMGNTLDNVLTGNSAANVLTGGTGNDTYVVGAGDAVVELADEGIDGVISDVSTTLGENLENLTIVGSRSVIGTGNALDNVLSAPGSISTLAGGFGNDLYVLGPGDDLDVIVEAAGGGLDTVRASRSVQLPDHIERLELVDPLLFNVTDSNPLNNLLFPRFQLTDPQGNPLGLNGVGNALANTLIGSQGNNRIDGGLGADTMIGGQGNDTYVVDHVGDVVTELPGEGLDQVESSVSYVLSAQVEQLRLVGTAAINATGNALANDLFGNDANNVLDGGAGTDRLFGGGGRDTYLLQRGMGQDLVFDTSTVGDVDTVQAASDITPDQVSLIQRVDDLVITINGTEDELLLAEFFRDASTRLKEVRFADGTVWNSEFLFAHAANTAVSLSGGLGNETLTGTGGNDTLIGDAGNDVLLGGLGDDTLYGDETFPPSLLGGEPIVGNDILRGGPGTDLLTDCGGTNLFDGGAGNDSLMLGTGQDTVLFGRGSGSDQVYFDRSGSDVDIIQLAADLTPADIELIRDDSIAPRVTLRIRDTGEQLTLNLSTNYPHVLPTDLQGRVQFADGTQWDLQWSPAVDPSAGTSGDDVLEAAFPSVLQGFAGNDEYRVGSAGVTGSFSVIEATGEGTDTVQSGFDYTLDINVENLILEEVDSPVLPNPTRGTGNESDNIIIGNTADNILDGGAGNDVLVGGLFYVEQDNHLVGGNGSDILIGGEGDDTLIPFVPNTRGAGFLDLSHGLSFGNEFIVQGEFSNVFPNVPDDLVLGGQGNDTYILFNAAETVIESPAEGVDTVKSVVDYTLRDNFENLTLLDDISGSFATQGTGNELANVLIGNLAGNILNGEGGEDTLWGGRGPTVNDENIPVNAGHDLLIGGSGDDTYLFNLGDGIDTIEDVAAAGEENRIQFGMGITQNDLTFTRDQAARTLTIQVGSSGMDKLVLTNFDSTGVNGSRAVETLAFAGGSTVSLASFLGGTVNHAPTVANPLADQTILEDTPLSIQIPANTFVDPDAQDLLTYSVRLADGTALPSWLTFNATTRTFSGTPQNGNVGDLTIAVTATDSGNLSATNMFVLTVQNVNDAPTVVTPLANHTTLEDVSFSFVVPADTFADADVGDTLTSSATLANGTALPSWLSFNTTTRTFSGTPTNSDVGTLNLSVTATDNGNLSATSAFTLTVQNVNDAPTVAAPLTDQLVTQGSFFSFVVPTNTFVDQDTAYGDTLTYSATRADGTALPTWLTFNPSTRTFSGIPFGADIGTLDVRVTATDIGILSASDVFALTVVPITGTAGNDALPGTAGDDVIQGLAGDDVLQGLGGNDLLDGGPGVDSMAGGLGNDIYVVDAAGDVVTEALNQGTDTVQSSITYTLGANVENLVLTGTAAINGAGNSLNNGLIGNSANNTLNGGAGADTMAGGQGNDIYVVDNVGDVVTELLNEGTDTVQTGLTHTLGANFENLTLTGSFAINGTGNMLDNVLIGNSAVNVLTGGAGNDTYVVGTGDTVVEQVNEGIDLVQSAVTWTLGAHVENLTLTGASTINGTGNSLTNVLIGNSAANTLDADGGDDILNGGAGADILIGGTDNDTYVVDNVGDVVTENFNEGTDLVRTSVSYTLSANVEHLTLTGAGAINATGNSLNNMLTGNSGANILDGAAGADSLIGGAGSDTYIVDNVGDAVTENVNEGTDTVQSSLTYTLTANVENLTLTGTGAINATGNTLNNTLTGNSGHNVLDGGGGTDTLLGGLGDDTYILDDVTDVVSENLNEGTDTIQTSLTYTLGANIENLLLTGANVVNGTGNALNNVLTGNLAANTLTGGAGVDTMVGGQGDDTYFVDNTGDVVTEQFNEGIDLVQSAVTYTLSANVENLTLTGTAAINATGNTLSNRLTGNSGANVLDGGVGADTLIGGAGNDTYVVDDVGDVVTEAAAQGTDTVQSAITYVLGTDVENLTLTGSTALNGTGNSLNNMLMGNSAANTLTGLDGNDTLDGEIGADTLVGGLGNDIYLVDNIGDIVMENLNEGTDLVQSSVSYILTANVENLTLTGTTAINGVGNALNNTLTGNSAANVLTGGAGNDTYVVSVGDSIVENVNEGTDTVQSDVSWTLGANLENLTLTGTTAIEGVGNSLANTLRGNSAANVLSGGVGNDTYVVSVGDTIIENANEGTDTVQSDVSRTLGANLENLTLTGTATIDATGNTLSNTLTGNNAANQLVGGLGNDTLRGGLGNDTYLINRGDGQDVIIENDSTVGNSDRLQYGSTINPFDLVISRQVNDLRLAVHGSADQVTMRDWYLSTNNRVETVQAGNGALLLSTQVDQLIQAMASFSQQSGLTWDQAIDQRPQDVQAILAANWQ